MRYVRKQYGVPVKRGMTVEMELWGEKVKGRVTFARRYVHVRCPDGKVRYFHPTSLTYYNDDGQQIWP